MKKQLLHAVGLIATLAFAVHNSQATITAYDGFAYADGSNISGQAAPAPLGTWGNNGGSPVGLTGSLSYGALITSGNQAISSGGGRPPLSVGGNADTGGIQYISWLVSNSNVGVDGYSAFELQLGGSVFLNIGGSNNGNSNLEFTMETGTGFVNSGVLRSDATTFFVLKIDYTGGPGADVATYWVNPSVGGSETVSSLTATGSFGFTDISFGNFATTTFNYDELRFGTTWASVTPIPEPSTYALLALGFGAVFFLRRRRAA